MAGKLATRRQSRNEEVEVTFAALPLNLEDAEERAYAKQTMTVSRASARQAWLWYRRIGEVQFAVTRNARIAGYADLAAYRLNQDGSIGEKLGPNTRAAQVTRGMYSRFGGTRALIERYFTLMKVPGDGYLFRTKDGDGNYDGYDWASSDELDMDSVGANKDAENRVVKRKVLPSTPNGGVSDDVLREEIPIEDFLGRVWRPDGQFAHMPDSPLYALEDVCEILWLLTRGLKGKMRSRIAMNGLLYIASEVNKVRSAASAGSTGEKFHANEVIDELMKAAVFAVTNPELPESTLPAFLVGPGVNSEHVKFIEPERQILETEIKLRAELIDRLLFGLDINPQAVKGSTESSHWGAWAASDDERRVAVSPDLEIMCWALTRLVLWPQLKELGATNKSILNTVVWYDLSKATAKTNLAEDARQAFDRGAINREALLVRSGMPVTDAPSDEELVRQFGWDAGDPYLATFGLDIQDRIDWDKVSKQPGPKADGSGDRARSGPGKGDPGSPNPKDRRPNGPRSSRPD